MDKRTPTSRYFIVGTQKSGTTWLRDCLNLVVPTIKCEPYYIELYDGILRHLSIYASQLLGSGLDDAARDSAVAAYEVLMAQYQGDKSAYPCSSAIGNVRPDLHPLAVRLIRQHFSQSRVIVIVRDPRSVFVSLCHYLDHFRPGRSSEIDPVQFGSTWSTQNQQWLSDEPHSIVKYEDLKSDFDATIQNTFSSVGLSMSQPQIDDMRNRVYDVNKLRPNQPEIFRKGLIDEWKSVDYREAVSIIEKEAKPLMERLGYT